MSEVAKSAGLGRESLYKALNPDAQPRFDTVQKTMSALGVTLTTTSKKAHQDSREMVWRRGGRSCSYTQAQRHEQRLRVDSVQAMLTALTPPDIENPPQLPTRFCWRLPHAKQHRRTMLVGRYIAIEGDEGPPLHRCSQCQIGSRQLLGKIAGWTQADTTVTLPREKRRCAMLRLGYGDTPARSQKKWKSISSRRVLEASRLRSG